MRTPNIGLQRTSRRPRAAAEAGAFARVSIVAAAIAVIGSSLFVRPVGACDCFDPPDLKSAVKSADAVFAGKVVSVTVGNDGTTTPPQVVQFEATEAWKGIRSVDVEVSTGGGWDCNEFVFEQGKRYLVFAKRDGNGFSTGQCMGNFWVWRDYELRDIRKLLPGKKLTK